MSQPGTYSAVSGISGTKADFVSFPHNLFATLAPTK